MIKSAKRGLRRAIGRSYLTYDELLTLVIEVEAVLNSRPLGYVSSKDTEEPLTPSHLLHSRGSHTQDETPSKDAHKVLESLEGVFAGTERVSSHTNSRRDQLQCHEGRSRHGVRRRTPQRALETGENRGRHSERRWRGTRCNSESGVWERTQNCSGGQSNIYTPSKSVPALLIRHPKMLNYPLPQTMMSEVQMARTLPDLMGPRCALLV